ncbi:E3 ubiquitin/ISG15 ligase TRIM25-like [Spea bombifrons]|uniref:E3 ubiquitin/ISG15 ligase TRIM25-like n=1 Tax=Spea bombifrons TaxID=233779 RepID=UPI00234B020A|nr:E3 ubiquitin/ISG15 ligase TRIM25-like [Spea bombifrons]
MAEDRQLLLRLQPNDLTCSICISHYTFPTTLPCGHTFCKNCIERYWQEKTRLICPMCQTSFEKKPELNKNTDIASLLEILRKPNNRTHKDCQSCTGRGALKLCLPCMAPLCKDHLLLHSEDTLGQRHLLVNPLTGGSTWLCRDHEEGLQYFCEPHCSPLCPACVVQHKACKPELLLHRYRANKEKIQERIAEVNKDITIKEHEIMDLKNAYQEFQILVCDIKDNLTRDFREMRDYIEKQERASFWRIQMERDRAQKGILGAIQPLTVQIEELKKLKADLEDNLQNNWMEVLTDTKESDISQRASPATWHTSIFDENRIIDTTLVISEIKQSLLAHGLLEQRPCPPKQVFEETIGSQTVPSTGTGHPAVNAPPETGDQAVNAPLVTGDPAVNAPLETGDPAVNAPLVTGDPAVNAPLETGDPAVNTPLETGDPAVNAPLETGYPAVNAPLETGDLAVNAPLDTGYRNLLQWAQNLSFDRETVHNRLSLLQNSKTVIVTGTVNKHPKHSRRFTCSQVLCCEGFSAGCHYWEINTKDSNSWAIAAAAKEMGIEDKLGRNGCSWCVEWNKEHLSTWHANEAIIIPHGKPDTVGVFLDCGERVITFYSVQEAAVTLLHSYRLDFQTEIFPAVWLFGLKAGNSLTIKDLRRL